MAENDLKERRVTVFKNVNAMCGVEIEPWDETIHKFPVGYPEDQAQF